MQYFQRRIEKQFIDINIITLNLKIIKPPYLY